ncbi:MAG TPA: NADH pyrophosphatase zinc ribbon domain-containing protein, partial [Propionibacteriaceae bacterium]|nr:NADH pyrophosphatase zinc ribbon domain-containing protein [Propionibacteriaceae bacterium]
MTDQPRILDTWALQPTLDRGADLRHDTEELDRLWSTARLIVVDREGRFSESLGSASVGEYEPERHLFLGRVDGAPWFAMRGDVGAHEVISLREQAIDSPEREVATAAVALLAWHERARFCERCGHGTRVSAAGFARRCDGCGAEHFPRTDPAVIVAIVDSADRLLLAHQVT